MSSELLQLDAAIRVAPEELRKDFAELQKGLTQV
jgi:hypothetical protein